MNIACFGDSWTYAYGVEDHERWPSLLGAENVIVDAECGGANSDILEMAVDTIKSEPLDLVIVGWSGVTRYVYKKQHLDFCHAEDLGLRNTYFKNITMQNLQDNFLKQNKRLDEICKEKKIKCIKFSVFNDFKYLWDDNFLDYSFLNFLAEKQNNNFEYDIPFFEFDFLAENNIKLTTRFAKKYLDKNWKKACVEREDIRPGKYFLDCGHPNRDGHQLWANYVKENI